MRNFSGRLFQQQKGVYASASHLFLCLQNMTKPGLALLLTLIASTALANQQLDSLKHISAAGAPFLTLKMLEQAQPGVDQDLYEWILWEQERFQDSERLETME